MYGGITYYGVTENGLSLATLHYTRTHYSIIHTQALYPLPTHYLIIHHFIHMHLTSSIHGTQIEWKILIKNFMKLSVFLKSQSVIPQLGAGIETTPIKK